MRKKRPEGICHICGVYDKLSEEHVPPQSAFNKDRSIVVDFYEALKLGPDDKPRGRIQQGGIAYYTLCERCNNITGKWYSTRFANWCYQGMDILMRSNGKPTLFYLNHLLPLAIIKQIVTMFFSINGDRFRVVHPELVDFVLNRDKKYLSPRYRIYVYYNPTGKSRRSGVMCRGNIHSTDFVVMSEITHIPFGYVMTFDSPPPDPRLVEITHFASYDYNDFVVQELRLPVLPVHLVLPGDYRTKEEIEETYQRNMAVRRRNMPDG